MGDFPHLLVRPAGLPAIGAIMVFPPDPDGVVEASLMLKQQARSAVAKWAEHFGVGVVETELCKDRESGVREMEYAAVQKSDGFRVRAWTVVVVHPGTAPEASGETPGAAG